MAEDTEKWHFMASALKTVAKKLDNVSTLEKSHNELKCSLQSARGKITRLENDLERAQKKVLDLECTSLQKNAVFYNLEETPEEDSIKVINDFLEQELKINSDLLSSPTNPRGVLEIDSAFRIGALKKRPRPLLVKFTTSKSKDIVARQYQINKPKSRVRMSDHFPLEIKEKRMAQVEDLKQYGGCIKKPTPKYD